MQKDINMSLLEFESVIVSAYQKGDNGAAADGTADGGNMAQQEGGSAADGAAGGPDLQDQADFPGMS